MLRAAPIYDADVQTFWLKTNIKTLKKMSCHHAQVVLHVKAV